MDISLGSVLVKTEDNRGHSPEFWAERCVDKLVYISDKEMPEHIRQQAHAFRKEMYAVVLHHMKRAIESEEVTLRAKIMTQIQGD